MVLQSRKWRMAIRTVTLLVCSVLLLIFAAPASYALHEDAPKPITLADDLVSKERPLAESYVYTWAVPDLDRAVTTKQFGTTYYWIPLKDFGNRLFIRAEGEKYAADLVAMEATAPSNTANFYGKLTSIGGQVGADDAIEALRANGIAIDTQSKDSVMVMLYGEQPRSYRPIIPVWTLLAIFWVLALVGLVKILRGRQQPRRRQVAEARS